MRDTFATTAALDGHGTRLGRMEDSLHAASDAATAAHAKALEIERRQDDRWAHINQRWDETADRFERAVDRMESYLERITRLEERVNHSRVA